jgi:hypothetical protein
VIAGPGARRDPTLALLSGPVSDTLPTNGEVADEPDVACSGR